MIYGDIMVLKAYASYGWICYVIIVRIFLVEMNNSSIGKLKSEYREC